MTGQETNHESGAAAERALKGVVTQGSDDEPAVGATVVLGIEQHGQINRLAFTTDVAGRFVCPLPPGPIFTSFFAHKEGWSLNSSELWMEAARRTGEVKLRLVPPLHRTGFLVDESDRPLARAIIRVEMSAQTSSTKNGDGTTNTWTCYSYFRHAVLAGSPLEKQVLTTTDERGMFSFDTLPAADSWLRLAVTTTDGRHMRVKHDEQAGRHVGFVETLQQNGFVLMESGRATKLAAYPAARVHGRVSTRLHGVNVAGLNISYQGSRAQPNTTESNFGANVTADADGRFVFDDLNEGTINVFVNEPGPDVPWTFRAAQDVDLKSGWTRAVMIELIRGVEVEGTVVSHGQPFEGAELGMYGPNRPRSGGFTRQAKTDARGRYHYRLPPGETLFYVMGSMGDPPSQSQIVTIPEGVTHFEVPPIEIASTVVSGGQVVDATHHRPVARARVVGVCQDGVCKPFVGAEIITDGNGAFSFPPNTAIPNSAKTRIRIRLDDGSEHDGTPNPGFVGTIAVTVKLPR